MLVGVEGNVLYRWVWRVKHICLVVEGRAYIGGLEGKASMGGCGG